MMHIIIVTHDNSLPVLGATSVIPAERYHSPYLFLSVCRDDPLGIELDSLRPKLASLEPKLASLEPELESLISLSTPP